MVIKVGGRVNIRHTPIFMFQWSPETELNELESIEDRFNELAPALLRPEEFRASVSNEAFRESLVRQSVGYPGDELQDWIRAEGAVAATMSTHDIASFRMTNPEPSILVAQLGCLLDLWENAQTLYFSCHGTLEQLAFDDALTSVLSFKDFGRALARLPHDCVTLVLGCCYGLNEHSPILAHIPNRINEIYGFTGTPLNTDVASLMLGVLLDQNQIYRDISDLSTNTYGHGVGESDLDAEAARMSASLDAILDNFVEDPSQHVRGIRGVGIRWLKRVEYEGQSIWQGRTIPLGRR